MKYFPRLLIHEGLWIQNVVADKGYSCKPLADSLANIGMAKIACAAMIAARLSKAG